MSLQSLNFGTRRDNFSAKLHSSEATHLINIIVEEIGLVAVESLIFFSLQLLLKSISTLKVPWYEDPIRFIMKFVGDFSAELIIEKFANSERDKKNLRFGGSLLVNVFFLPKLSLNSSW